MHIACLQHVPFEGPAALADWAAQGGHQLRPVRLYAGEPLYRIEQTQMLIVLGGPMGVHDTAQCPWLTAEKRAIESALREGKPMLGVCLGAQLIADVLGAAVTRNPEPEIGWFPIQPVAGSLLLEPLSVLHWHGDTFSLPAGAQQLATSAACTQQGFAYANHVLAWQCHLESTPASVQQLVQNCAGELTPAPHVQPAARILAEPAATFTGMNKVLFAMLDALLARA